MADTDEGLLALGNKYGKRTAHLNNSRAHAGSKPIHVVSNFDSALGRDCPIRTCRQLEPGGSDDVELLLGPGCYRPTG